jgi:hypothetical protein
MSLHKHNDLIINNFQLHLRRFTLGFVRHIRTTWWRLYEGGGSQMFGRVMHLQIRTKLSAGMHPRFHKTAR